MTDWELLNAYVQQRSNEAMAELIGRHAGMVHGVAMRELRDAALAEDVTQAVFVVLMNRAKSLSPRVALGGWLFKTAMYAVADLRKQRRRREFHEREVARMIDTPPLPSGDPAAVVDDIMPRLNRALARLSEAERQAIILRYLESRPHAEVAATLGTTENTARQRVARALERLRDLLTRDGANITPAVLATTLESVQTGVPGHVLTALDGIVRGAAPSVSVQTLATGVLHMLRMTHYVFVGTTAAAVLAAAACITWAAGFPTHAPEPAVPLAVATVPVIASPADQATAVPATGPAATQKGPRDTPKGTMIAAWEAACADDLENFYRCLNGVDDQQKLILDRVVHTIAAGKQLCNAMDQKFGAGASGPVLKALVGVDPKDLTNAKESIDGDKATVDMGQSGPHTLPLIKKDGVWLVEASTMGMPNAQGVEQVARLTALLKMIAQDIKDGKYKTPQEVQGAIQELMAMKQAGPGLP